MAAAMKPPEKLFISFKKCRKKKNVRFKLLVLVLNYNGRYFWDGYKVMLLEAVEVCDMETNHECG